MIESLQGHFLIASPHLLDPNFHRTVVLLVHCGDDGALGLVVNRPTDSRVDDFWHTVSDKPCTTNECLHVGGPVSGPLMAIHTDPSLGEIEIIDGLFFSAQRDHIESLVSLSEASYRMFIGHSGWGSGQLDNEITEGSWLTKPASIAEAFADESEVWQRSAETVGQAILSQALHIKSFPEDPSTN